MVEYPVQWEYYTEYITAYVKPEMDFMQQFYPKGKIPKYAVQAILPRLNALGQQGWELVQMTPVILGANGDVEVHGGESRVWSNIYQCVFKRRKK